MHHSSRSTLRRARFYGPQLRIGNVRREPGLRTRAAERTLEAFNRLLGI